MTGLSIYPVLYAVLLCSGTQGELQDDVEYIGANLGVKFEVISNLNGNSDDHDSRLTLTNHGKETIRKADWEIYFTSLYMIEPTRLAEHGNTGYDIPDSGLRVHHVNGGLFKFTPNDMFKDMKQEDQLVADFKVQYWSISKTDGMPNWYVAAAIGGTAVPLVYTQTEHLESFGGDFDSSKKWKRYEGDLYNPWTPEERWARNKVTDLNEAPNLILPTPKEITVSVGKKELDKPLLHWSIFTDDESLQNEARFLQNELRWNLTTVKPARKFIELNESSTVMDSEGYEISIDGESETIVISSSTATGAYYGAQSLLAIMCSDSTTIPSMLVKDSPRYKYRGMHLDVARHFATFEDVIKLIKVMGMYKLNRLHFHLTDDEGWRVEMPWCSYLTTVGGKQCHDLTEKQCLIPQFGSDPLGRGRGSGYYTQEEYKEILRTAKQNHITVIPEVDMPGHSRAAIKATEAFLEAAVDTEEAESIQISDPDDASKYLSVQLYTDNALNPCLNSTYNFIEKLVQTFVEYHKDIQPLTVMHLGGDEVAENAWIMSEPCEGLLDELGSASELAEYFVRKISAVVKSVDENLTLALWEDGAITVGEIPFNRSEIETNEVLTHVWQNIWEWGTASRAYKLANEGYKVVMSQATHLYFDHPYEPDPEERGLYWATRFTDTQKTFSFLPDNLYANADTKRSGEPYSEEDMCTEFNCTELLKPENVVGMQGQIWSEVMRTSDQLFGNIFPRMLALAERAWHKADWEDESGSEMEAQRDKDWVKFANTLGYRELKRLDKMGINYRVPMPGIKIEDDLLQVNNEFPGLEVIYSSSSNPNRWYKYVHPISINETEDTYFQVRSADDGRGGRIVVINANVSCKTNGSVRSIGSRSLALIVTIVTLLTIVT